MEVLEAFVQPGKSGRQLANYHAQLSSLRRNFDDLHLAKAAADVAAENADAMNRRLWLYIENPEWDVTDLTPPQKPPEGGADRDITPEIAAKRREYEDYQGFKKFLNKSFRDLDVERLSERALTTLVDGIADADDNELDVAQKYAYGHMIKLDKYEGPQRQVVSDLWDSLYKGKR
ncbi:MAG: hypothetical protein SGARI_004115, partial [Bacillariaceae sp.]